MEEVNSWWALWWVKAGLYACLASLGGIMGHIMRSLDRQVPVHLGRAAVEGLSAGFVGLLVALLCDAMHLSDQWTGVIVGVSGWLGANASIRMLEKVVFKKLGLSSDGGEEPEEKKDA